MRATKIEADIDEKTQLLTDINCRMVKYKKRFLLETTIRKMKRRRKKKWQPKIWEKKASEKLSETTDRKGGNAKKRKASELVEYLKFKQDVNKANTEKVLSLREEELRLEKQPENQRGLQQQMAEQLKLLQQQCQAGLNIICTFEAVIIEIF